MHLIAPLYVLSAALLTGRWRSTTLRDGYHRLAIWLAGTVLLCWVHYRFAALVQSVQKRMEKVVRPKKDPQKSTAQTKGAEAGRYSVPVVLSTFRILDELSKADSLGFNEVTQRTGVAKSTVFRILSTLLQLGYVLRRKGKYSVTSRLATLANEHVTSETIRRVALPYMLRLRDEFGETVNLGILRLDKVEYIEVVPSEYALRFSERPGSSVQVHASALGKVLLAYATREVVHSLIGGRKLQMLTRNTITDPNQFIAETQKARQRGYAFDKGETSASAVCVAAPILGPSSRFNPRKDSPVIEKLQLAVAEISRQLRQRS